ncbi:MULTISPECIES: YegP family protein [Chryseobacterium]|jgi:uncharacterized protein YegP (UPF0339 family)|uniref:Uncharacterized protein YegP (UPF0339 family) n=1 Tax=Chryseobacterium geocarposphaerae TaxID=1416776 RepID=A0ABU1LBI5_9FLAO|nr:MULTISPECIES: YegP family protein [Chryseobacterium]MDR6404074.1 uncharacterized protein YegP (UPF0339 family) [Chryseobacterium geocarposphaerae]MDR6698407.1 uncharacterized protein YegP (UPF0339 family) [Chryseobacterium ginsenosidimutans]
MGKFIINRRADKQYQFNLKAENGEIILTSEGYVQKASCIRGIESVRVNSQDNLRYYRKVATNGKSFFILKAGNGQVIGKSQLYSSVPSMENGIKSIKHNAIIAAIIDETIIIKD